MKEKLIELIEDTLQDWECDVSDKTISEIAEHLIDNGVIVPLCKVGDIVWLAFPWFDSEAVKGKISMLQQKADGSWKIRVSDSVGVKDFPITEIGNVIFFTKEEAEKKLKECENK